MWTKVYFPESGFTKGEVIAFNSEIAEVILPHLRDRPLTLKRFPEGINREHFYERRTRPSTRPCGCSDSQFRAASKDAERGSMMCSATIARRSCG